MTLCARLAVQKQKQGQTTSANQSHRLASESVEEQEARLQVVIEVGTSFTLYCVKHVGLV